MLDLFDVTSRFWQKKKNLFSVISRRLIVEWALKKGNKLGLGEIGFFFKIACKAKETFCLYNT